MVKVSYCSLEEAFGEQIVSKREDEEDKKESNFKNKEKRVYKEHFDNSQKPIEKENNESESDSSDEDEDEDEEIMELKRRIEEKKRNKIKRKENKQKKITSDKIQLISNDTVETYANQMIDDNEMIDLFVLFILGVLIIYVLDYFFKLGLGK